MRILFLPVHPLLAPWVHSLWSFVSPEGLPAADRRLVVPHGRTKFILTLEGPLVLEDGPMVTTFPPGRALFVGPWDRAVVLSSAPGRTHTLGLELTPAGAHRFFDLPLAEVLNRVIDLADLWPGVDHWMAQMVDQEEVSAAAALFQNKLLARWTERSRAQPVVDFTVNEFQRRSGLVSIKELEVRTGYTRRTLDGLFHRHVGLSPKTLATIIRFQKVYGTWARAGRPDFYADLDPELYFDQSHLIREFKRFTGYAPTQFSRQANHFGRLFYSRPEA